jgi:lipopolysaccharide biosynthesis glycosyltransferase
MEAIEIVMATDEAFVRQLAVAVASISANCAEACRVRVLHDGVSPTARARVEASRRDHVDVEWIDARPMVDGHALPARNPRPTFFRLFVSELLPREVERVVYLDADVIVRRSLAPLWEMALDQTAIGAVRDAYRPWMVRNDTFRWREVGVAPGSPFFNSGVMVVDLEEWRRRDVGTRALALLSEQSRMFDQCALNIVHEDDWTALPPEWNLQTYHLFGDECLAYATEGPERLDAAVRDPAIVHFTGGSYNRPWQAPCGNPFRDEWLTYLDRTPWRGWRPEPATPLVRAWGRTQRALGVLRYGGGGDVRGGAGRA